MIRRVLECVGVLGMIGMIGCGGGSSSSGTPTTPTATNRAPVINSITISPTFGISELTSFNYSASASDPDGDAVTYTWDLAGNPASGSNGSITFVGGGTGTARVTVTDSKGATATDTRSFTVGSMSGNWTVTAPGYGTILLTLTQSGSFVTGSFSAPQGFGNAPPGSGGQTDPAEPGRIKPNGEVEIRLKVGRFLDFYLRGNMDQSGRQIAGGMFNSGFSGQPFTMVK